MKYLGLIGKSLSHSFSKKYFTKKFKKEELHGIAYELYELPTIGKIQELLLQKDLIGLNVTIPYKKEVIPYLHSLDESAHKVGAVNVIAKRNGKWTGFNTDYFGFKQSLANWINSKDIAALVLGTGGASLAIKAVLQDLSVPFLFVSRQAGHGHITYEELDEQILQSHHLVINTTPLGMTPDTHTLPDLPYRAITGKHYLYDLVYNPEHTRFLKEGERQGAHVKNGMDMLHLQAEKSWEIWMAND